MTYVDTILLDRPDAAWRLGTFEDATGNGYIVEEKKTFISPPMVFGEKSRQVNSDSEIYFESGSLLRAGSEGVVASLELWYHPVELSYTAGLLVKDDNSECGLYANKWEIYFQLPTVEYGVVRLAHKLRFTNSKSHIVVLYGPVGISLWVDGKLGDQFTFPAAPTFTPDMVGIRFKTSLVDQSILYSDDYLSLPADDANLTYAPLGYTDDADWEANQFIIGAPAIYASTLAPDAVARHYSAGISAPSVASIASAHDTLYYEFSDNKVVQLRKVTFNGRDFNAGITDNLIVTDDGLTQVADGTGTWQRGSWTGFIPLDTMGLLASTKITYNDMPNVVVRTALDSAEPVWQPRDAQVACIPPGTNVDGKALFVYVEFLETDDTLSSVLEWLDLSFYATDEVQGNSSTSLVTTSPDAIITSKPFEPIDFTPNAGVKINKDSFIVAEVADGETYSAIELWIIATGNAAGVILDNGVSSVRAITEERSTSNVVKLYVNGVLRTGVVSLQKGVPTHLYVVLPGQANSQIHIGSDSEDSYEMSVIFLAKHRVVLGDEVVNGLYESYVGSTPVIIMEDPITVTEKINPLSKSAFFAHTTQNPTIISV